MPDRVLDRLKGLLALTAVVATLVAPPIALTEFVGNPLPASAPSWQSIVDGLTRNGISDRTVIEVLAVLAWIVWAQLAIALIAEMVAVARGRQVTRLPLLPGVQPIAARWLAAAALLLAPLAASPSAAATKPAPLPVPSFHPGALAAQIVETPLSGIASNEDPGPSTAGATTEQRLTEYVVQRHDSFWDIAERFIGDPFRWREIRDLNVGRPQPNGETVEAGSDLIRPGWLLRVPADDQHARSHETPALPGEWTVAPGDHLWGVADTALSTHFGRAASDDEVRPYWESLIDVNRDVLADPANPSIVFAGQVLRLPPPPGSDQPSPVVDAAATRPPPPPVSPMPAAPEEQEPAAPTGGHDAASTTTPTTSVTPTAAATDVGPSEPAETGDDEAGATVLSTGLLGVAGVGIAVGIAATVRRRRQVRLARAPVGFAPPPMPDELGALRTEVALGADVDASDDLRRATSVVAAHVAATRGLGRRRARLVQICPDRVEVLLDEPALPAPPTWDAEASGAVWSCSRPIPALNGRVACPALVTIGSDDDNVVVLDIESAGVVTIDSHDPVHAQALVRSMILELAHSPLADSVALVTVGDIEPLEPDRVRRVDHWDDVAQDALSWARQSLQVLAAHRFSTVFAARGTDRALDGIASMIIVCSEPPASETFEAFATLAHEGAAACAVVVGGDSVPGATHLRIDGEVIDIPALGLACRVQGISPDTVDRVGLLLAAADQPPEPMTLFDERDVIELDPSSGEYGDPPWDILVHTLGEIRVVGGHKPLTPKQTGMLTFVALHDPCSVDRIEDAIWPTPMDTRRQQVHNTASRIRSALGADHLPASTDSEYRVGSRVRTDLDLLRRRATYAASQPPEQAINTLRGALEFVDGPAFTYRNADRASFAWVDTEHWTSDTEARVVEVAWRLWKLCIGQGDTEGAIWAARQGLLASPGNTELTEALMRAYITAGDRAAAEDVFVSHAKALDELDQDDPAPSTLQLWEDLREGREPSHT